MLPIPYKGTQPFLFVSYSHENKAAAYDLIFRLQKGGLRVWYDGGMEPGENWLQILPGRLKNCCCILALITREFTTSKWCPRELITGDNLDKTILPVFMERVVLPDSLQFLLADSNVLRSEVFSGDQEAFYSYLCGLKSLDGCRDAEPQPIPELPAEVPAAVEEAPDPWTLEPAGNPEDFLVSAGILTAYRGGGGLIKVPEGIRVIGSGAFRGRVDIRAVILPEGVSELAMGAFSDCTALEGVILPQSLTKLGVSVFSGCTALKNITLPDGLKVLPWFAFYNCTQLEALTVPRGVTAIGDQCFCGCRMLKQISLPETAVRLGSDVFSGCIRLKEVTGAARKNHPAFTGTPWSTL